MLEYFPLCHAHNQVAFLVETEFVRSLKAQPDGLQIGAWCDHEIVLQLSLVAIKDQIHAWIDVLVVHPGVRRYISVPLLRVIADQVVAAVGKFVLSDDLRRGMRTQPLHAQNGRGRDRRVLCLGDLRRHIGRVRGPGLGGLGQDQHGFGGREKKGVAGAAGQVLNLAVGLPLVGFKTQGQFAVGFQYLLTGRRRIFCQSIYSWSPRPNNRVSRGSLNPDGNLYH